MHTQHKHARTHAQVWDHIFLGKPAPSDCAVPADLLAKMRQEFEYWYPFDLRVSGKVCAECACAECVYVCATCICVLLNARQHACSQRDMPVHFLSTTVSNTPQDLIGNHLTMALYNHTAIWPDQPGKWPGAIRCNGHLMLNSEKMSKSKGNFKTLKQV